VASSPEPAQLPAAVPVVPGYEIQQELGRGGMGVVYQAHHSRLDRLVAIKFLPAEVGKDAAFAERFTREARALAKLNHPNIITVYDFGEITGLAYFIMQFVQGANLRTHLRAGRLDPPEVLRIIGQICDALQYAHEEGIVHRDIKPENILLDKRGQVKIADFGIAKLLSRKQAEYTLTGPMQVIGTLNYMAPEQIDNPLGLDHRADIYSLGVMLYEMLTGQLPMGRFAPPSQKVPIDVRLDEVVLRALEREPERRYQTVSEMKAALATLGLQTAVPSFAQAGRPREIEAHPQAAGQAATTAPYSQQPANWREADSAFHELRKPVIGFFVTGVLYLATPLLGVILAEAGWARRSFFEAVPVFLFLFFAPVAGLLCLWGARQMHRIGSYRYAALGCYSAMMPVSPAWFISLWIGLDALMRLKKPEVKAAFLTQRAHRAVRRPPWQRGRLRRWLATASNWTRWFSLLGAVACFQPFWPWCKVQVLDTLRNPITLAEVYGYDFGLVLGLSSGVVFFGLLWLFFVMGFGDHVRLWHPILLCLAGLAILLASFGLQFPGAFQVGVYDESFTNQPRQGGADFFGKGRAEISVINKRITTQFSVQSKSEGTNASFIIGPERVSATLPKDSALSRENLFIRLKLSYGPAWYMTVIAALGLLLVGTLQLRTIIQRRKPPALDS
jgi:predicted Ser/Thr protein kinase